MASAAAAQWQPTTVARAALATTDPAADGGANQSLTQVPLNQRLPHIRRRKPSAPTRQPAAAAANIVSEPVRPPCPVAATPASTAAASAELPACLPRPPSVLQTQQPQPHQAGIPCRRGPATVHSILAHLPLLPLQQQQQSAMAPPAQAGSACTGIATCPAAQASHVPTVREGDSGDDWGQLDWHADSAEPAWQCPQED